jgi:hypothetical protein
LLFSFPFSISFSKWKKEKQERLIDKTQLRHVGTVSALAREWRGSRRQWIDVCRPVVSVVGGEKAAGGYRRRGSPLF